MPPLALAWDRPSQVTTATQNTAPPELVGTSTAAGLMFRQVGGSIAVAVFGALFASGLARSMASGAEAALDMTELGPQMLAHLSPQQQADIAQAVAQNLHPLYWIAFGLALVGVALTFILKEVPLSNQRPNEGHPSE